MVINLGQRNIHVLHFELKFILTCCILKYSLGLYFHTFSLVSDSVVDRLEV